MALWIKTRPDEQANPDELAVANRLRSLPDTWLVIWGYYYSRNRNSPLDSEGDFIVQSPKGDVLVIEVKGGAFRRFVTTGEWEIEGRKDPREQLNAECKSVMDQLSKACPDTQRTPRVAKALALPMLQGNDYHELGSGWEGTHLLDRDTLENFEYWWDAEIAPVPTDAKVSMEARAVLIAAIAKDAQPEALKNFSNMTDRLFLRQARGEYRLLDRLAENHRFSFTGGPGTGKSFFAIECARRFAGEGEGRRVLMPIFNLPLCHYLKRLFKEHPPKRGSVTVLSQGEIARMIFDRAGVSVIFPEPTASVEVRTPFFQKTLPEALGKVLVNGGVSAAFDALVVDEAQDHDTAKPGLPDGWWGVYRSLLTDCAAAPVAVFFDLNQRALFNSTTTFDPAEVNRVFPGCVRVRLDRALRYTGNIRRYVAKISGIPLVDTDEDSHSAAGMPVTDCEVDASGMAAAIATLIAKWRAAGIVTEPGHVLLLSPRGALARTSLAGHAEIAGVPVAEYDETAPENRDVYRHLNIHRAKGLDERAVILFDLLKPESSPNPAQTRQSHLLGASRARQALAVLWLKAPASA